MTATAVKTTVYLGVGVCLSIGVMNILNWPSKEFWPHFVLLTFILFVFCVTLLAIASLLTRHSDYEVPFEAAKSGPGRSKPPATAQARSVGPCGPPWRW